MTVVDFDASEPLILSDPMVTDEGESLSDVLGDFAGPTGDSHVGSDVPESDPPPPMMDSAPPPPASEPPLPEPEPKPKPPPPEPKPEPKPEAPSQEHSTIEALNEIAEQSTGDTDSILASQVSVSELIAKSRPPPKAFSVDDLAEKDQKVARFVLGKRASRDLEAQGEYIVHRGDEITEEAVRRAVDADMLTLLFLAASDGG
jgi:hypothetical protein